MALATAAFARQLGEQGSRMSAAVSTARVGTLSENPLLTPLTVLDAPVLALDLDPVEDRYLLVTDSKARVKLFDLASAAPLDQAAGPANGSTPLASYPPRRRAATFSASESSSAAAAAANADGTSIAGHTSAVSCVQWYPVDAGLFVTGGFDGRVLAWDPNTFEPTYGWQMDGASGHCCLSYPPLCLLIVHRSSRCVAVCRQLRVVVVVVAALGPQGRCTACQPAPLLPLTPSSPPPRMTPACDSLTWRQWASRTRCWDTPTR